MRTTVFTSSTTYDGIKLSMSDLISHGTSEQKHHASEYLNMKTNNKKIIQKIKKKIKRKKKYPFDEC